MNSTDNRKFEEEVYDNLHLDDDVILAKRIYSHYDYIRQNHTKSARITSHSRTQWTRIHDGVQEHFSSHVLINGSAYKLPSHIYAMKQISKQSWMLYKKRECERRKRLRVKLEKERAIEAKGGPANILLSMVDACEICKKLFVTVNLFWGLTLCDTCYFNEDVIKDIMKQRNDYINNDHNNPYRIVERVLAEPNSNDRFFAIPKSPELESKDRTPPTPFVLPDLSPDIIVANEEKDDDCRPISTYIPLPPKIENEESCEEFIHEEDENGDSLHFDEYFSQTSFLDPDNLHFD